jgi:hypothetical protein
LGGESRNRLDGELVEDAADMGGEAHTRELFFQTPERFIKRRVWR